MRKGKIAHNAKLTLVSDSLQQIAAQTVPFGGPNLETPRSGRRETLVNKIK
jgi:hypothetical protein